MLIATVLIATVLIATGVDRTGVDQTGVDRTVQERRRGYQLFRVFEARADDARLSPPRAGTNRAGGVCRGRLPSAEAPWLLAYLTS